MSVGLWSWFKDRVGWEGEVPERPEHLPNVVVARVRGAEVVHCASCGRLHSGGGCGGR